MIQTAEYIIAQVETLLEERDRYKRALERISGCVYHKIGDDSEQEILGSSDMCRLAEEALSYEKLSSKDE